jgi:hypothetical protein
MPNAKQAGSSEYMDVLKGKVKVWRLVADFPGDSTDFVRIVMCRPRQIHHAETQE